MRKRKASRSRSGHGRRRSWRSRKSLLLVFALVFAPAVSSRARAACVEFPSPLSVVAFTDSPRSVAPGDIDGDGDLDAVAAAAYSKLIAWYENDGTGAGWTPTTIAALTVSDGDVTFVRIADLDRDGDLDALALQAFPPEISWFANDGGGGGWTRATISADLAGQRGAAIADIDGDGDLDVADAAILDPPLSWLENDGSGAGWTVHTIVSAGLDASSVAAGDLDRDGDLDVLAASPDLDQLAWYENDGDGGGWTAQTIATLGDVYNFRVALGDLDGDGDDDAIAGANGWFAWYANDGGGGTWTAHSIPTGSTSATSIVPADVDGDGDLDLYVSSYAGVRVVWFENGAAGTSWTLHTLLTLAVAASSLLAGDLDGDGDVDALAALLHQDRVEWYRNDRLHGEALFAPTATVSAVNGPTSISSGDVDGDGVVDVLAAFYGADQVAWYEHDGTGSNWTEHLVASALGGAYSVFPADVDGDGQLDAILAALYDDTVAWYENDGSPLDGGWVEHEISTTVDGARSVFAADLDGDGHLDVLSASSYLGDDVIAWYRNDGGAATVWTTLVISTAAGGAVAVFAADLDGDGDVDVLSASTSDDTIAWYENDGSPLDGGWIEQEIWTAADAAFSVVAADVDSDGHLDVLSASRYDNTIAWYRNDGGDPIVWSIHEITTAASGATSVFAADLDGDGDVDALAASRFDGKVTWFENDGSGTVWTAHELPPTMFNRFAVAAADVDGDGQLDVLSASYGDDNLSWHHNLGTRLHDDGFDSDGATTACWSVSNPPVP